MAGAQQYKDVEILFVLKAILRGLSLRWIITMFERRFGRRLTENQVRYIKNKYGRDPRFGTPVANTQNFVISSSSNDWPENDGILEIDFSQFERQGAHVPQPNLRVSNLRRTASQSTPASASPAGRPVRPPRNCPGPLIRGDDILQGTPHSRAPVAGRKRTQNGDGDGDGDDDDELTGSLDTHIDQSPLLETSTNVEPYFFEWDEHDVQFSETEPILQQIYHQPLPDNALIPHIDRYNLPLGSEIPGWFDVFQRSDLFDRYEPHMEQDPQTDIINASSTNLANTAYQQIATSVPASHQHVNQQAPLIIHGNPLQLPEVSCHENDAQRAIQAGNNSIVKPELGHYDDTVGSEEPMEPQQNGQTDPVLLEPPSFVDSNLQLMQTWQAHMASTPDSISGIAPDYCPQNTVWTRATSEDTLTLGNGDTPMWTTVEARLSSSMRSSVAEGRDAAGSWDHEPSYEGFNYFDEG
ncbi:hypothetical protein EsDP_00007151 [Epichloe bromicola]|uniref:Clr5 domain-containing protein n=1 Tax=Epichloe bromicola TaxID=79588 RepID=A0ABQ0CZQ2_9HYPO